jgi:hypothetical protein
MSSKLEKERKARIDTAMKEYYASLIDVKKIYNSSVFGIQGSKLNSSQKTTLFRQAYNAYVSNLSNLKKNVDEKIAKINVEFNSYIAQGFTTPAQVVNALPKSRALLIGINYIGSPYELSGCIYDTELITKTFNHNGITDIKALTDKSSIKPTRENILYGIKNVLEVSKSGDTVYLFYSGHGGSIVDSISGDENDNQDEYILSLDLYGITDDEIRQCINANMKAGVTLFALFDCCNSGTVMDLRYTYTLNNNLYSVNIENEQYKETPGTVVLISGCRDDQLSSESTIDSYNQVQGAMTWAFIQTLKQFEVTNNLSWKTLMITMNDKLRERDFNQNPQITCGKLINMDDKCIIQKP